MKTTKLFYALIILMTVTLIGCSYNNVFEIDKFSEEEGGQTKEIKGISDIYGDEVTNVNVVFIHGMGIHPQKEELQYEVNDKGEVKIGELKQYQNDLAIKLGFEPDKSEYNGCTHPLTLKGTGIIGGCLHHQEYTDKTRTLNMFALSWDEITLDIQKAILELDDDFYEKGNGTNREKDRVWGNRGLKKFVNTSFADPVLYVGEFGEQIRYLVAQGIYHISMAEDDPDPINNQIVLISDSMGSSVTIDTINMIKAAENDTKSADEVSAGTAIDKVLAVSASTAINKFLEQSTLLFMNANQLPLIELGKITPPNSSCPDDPKKCKEDWLKETLCSKPKFSTFINTRNANKSFQELGNLQVVAFTDPNDLLSYKLTKRFWGECGAKGAKMINVMLTNAKWNWFFSLAWPETAHTGFKQNDKALELIVNGNH